MLPLRLLLIVGLLGLAACRKAPEISFTLPAAQLYADYKDAAQADQKYLGKWVEISGLVDRTGRDIGDTPYIAFAGDSVGGVECYFISRDAINLADYPSGKAVKIRARCLGRTLHVILDSAEIIH